MTVSNGTKIQTTRLADVRRGDLLLTPTRGYREVQSVHVHASGVTVTVVGGMEINNASMNAEATVILRADTYRVGKQPRIGDRVPTVGYGDRCRVLEVHEHGRRLVVETDQVAAGKIDIERAARGHWAIFPDGTA